MFASPVGPRAPAPPLHPAAVEGIGGPSPGMFAAGMHGTGAVHFGIIGHGHGGLKRHGSDVRADGARVENNQVEITIIAGRKLVAGDTGPLNWGRESSDPYCVVRPVKGLHLEKKDVCKTKMVQQSLNPEWNEHFRLQFDHKLSRFKICVIDYDQLKEHDMLGKLVIGLPAFYELVPDGEGWRTLESWFPLGVGSTAKWNWLRGRSSLGDLHVRIRVRFSVPIAVPLSCVTLNFPQVQIALGWDFDKHGRPFDVDASLIGFGPVVSTGAGWNVVDRVSYKQLVGFGGAVRHSGDDTTGHGEGDDETITVDLACLPPHIECLCLVVNSFTGQSLKQVKHAYVRVIVNGVTATFLNLYDNKVDKDAWQRGDRRVANPFMLRECTGLFFGMLFRSNGSWAFVTVNEAANGRTVEESFPMIVHWGQQFLQEARAKIAETPQIPRGPSKITETPQLPRGASTVVAEFAIGCAVEYFSQNKKQWFPAKVVGFHPSTGLYDLDIKPGVPPEVLRLIPVPSSGYSPDDFAKGTKVEYLSQSTNTWMPATILRVYSSTTTFDIDVNGNLRQQVPHDRIRLPQVGVHAPITKLVGPPPAPAVTVVGPPPSSSVAVSVVNETNPFMEDGPPAPAATSSGVSKDPRQWKMEQVLQFIEELGFGHVKDKFRDNGIDGAMLVELSEQDLCEELGLTKLQARKVVQRLPSSTG